MASLYTRNNSYYLNYSDAMGQHRISLGPIDKSEAEKKLAAKRYELLGGQTGEFVKNKTTAFKHFLKKYLDWHRSLFPDSHARINEICASAFNAFSDKALCELSAEEIDAWVAQRTKRITKARKAVARGTVTKELRTLKAILNKAVEWNFLNKNPALLVKDLKSLNSKPIHFYTKEELQKLYTRENGIYYKLIANLGLRRAEVKHAKWEDVQNGAMRVVSTPTSRTKSGLWRNVPLSKAAQDALEGLRAHSQSEYIFPRFTKATWSAIFKKDLADLGLKGSFHSLRHSFGAHNAMNGVPLRVLQVLMGHQSFTTTERYAHISTESIKNVVSIE